MLSIWDLFYHQFYLKDCHIKGQSYCKVNIKDLMFNCKCVNTVLIGRLDGMEMVPHLSLVLIADWYLVPPVIGYCQLLEPMTNEVPSPFHPTDQSGQY